MAAKYILLGAAALFLIAALVRLGRDGWRMSPAARTWLLIAVIFSAVGGWLLVST